MEELEIISKFRLPRLLHIELCNRMDKYCSATCDRSPLLSCKYNHVNVQTCDIKQSRTCIQYRTLVHVMLIKYYVLPSSPRKTQKTQNMCVKTIDTCVSVPIYCEINKRNEGPSILTKKNLIRLYLKKKLTCSRGTCARKCMTIPPQDFHLNTKISLAIRSEFSCSNDVIVGHMMSYLTSAFKKNSSQCIFQVFMS